MMRTVASEQVTYPPPPPPFHHGLSRSDDIMNVEVAIEFHEPRLRGIHIRISLIISI